MLMLSARKSKKSIYEGHAENVQVPVGRLRQVLQHFSRRSAAECVKGSTKLLEISWTAIKGIDFANRLCEDGRLVLEPAHFQQLSFAEVQTGNTKNMCCHN